ncbi:unnamed protein product, partial [Urochloa humidicola]
VRCGGRCPATATALRPTIANPIPKQLQNPSRIRDLVRCGGRCRRRPSSPPQRHRSPPHGTTMRHLLLSRLLRRGSNPASHHLALLRTLSSAPSPASSADLRKYAGYALLLLGCGAATYYSFPFPADALHKKAVPFKYAPLPEDLHAVSNWSATHEVHARVLLQPDSLPALEDALAVAHKERRKLRPLGSGLSPNGIGLSRAGMVSLALMDKVLDIDVKKKTVTVQAGIRVAELVDALREHGLTLQNFASIREQQVGGFIQVGAHGTGARLPPVDEQVISMKLV